MSKALNDFLRGIRDREGENAKTMAYKLGIYFEYIYFSDKRTVKNGMPLLKKLLKNYKFSDAERETLIELIFERSPMLDMSDLTTKQRAKVVELALDLDWEQLVMKHRKMSYKHYLISCANPLQAPIVSLIVDDFYEKIEGDLITKEQADELIHIIQTTDIDKFLKKKESREKKRRSA